MFVENAVRRNDNLQITQSNKQNKVNYLHTIDYTIYSAIEE